MRLGTGCALALWLAWSPGPHAADGDGATVVPVVVELFTSQGCSSCPPADALLRELDDQPLEGARLIVLSQHVDYWDGLGWKDPFSSRAASRRQRHYGERLAGGRVYTPQLVVDGAVELVGNRRQEVHAAIAAAARRVGPRVAAEVEVAWTKGGTSSLRVVVPRPDAAEAPFDVMLAITESGLSSDVGRGENAGRTLEHAGVVRRLESLGTVRPAAGAFEKTWRVPLDPSWRVPALRAVVFLQESNQGPIVGAAVAPLAAGARP